jgi:hypothetical protein
MKKVIVIEKKDTLSYYYANFFDYLKVSGAVIERYSWDNFKQKNIENEEDDLLCFLEVSENKHVEKIRQIKWKGSELYLCVNTKKQANQKIDGFEDVLKDPKTLGSVLDISWPAQWHAPFFRNFMQYYTFEHDSRALSDIEEKLELVFSQVKTQLEHIKAFHEQITPRRHSTMKGLDIVSKYSVGQSAGGDFFDVIQKDNQVLFFLSSSPSYVLSGSILGIFTQLRKNDHFNAALLEEFISAIEEQRKQLGIDEEGTHSVSLFLALLDLKTFKISGFNFGGSRMISGEHLLVGSNDLPPARAFMDDAQFNTRLERGSKILLVSKGVKENTGDLLEGRPLIDYVRDEFSKRSYDIINNLFYQMKRVSSGGRLEHDASAIIIEVAANVIYKV